MTLMDLVLTIACPPLGAIAMITSHQVNKQYEKEVKKMKEEALNSYWDSLEDDGIELAKVERTEIPRAKF